MRYFIITFGCQMNKSDSERIALILEQEGHKPALKINGADLIVVNMCSVRQSAVDRVYGLIPKFGKLKAKTILTGCILKKDRSKFVKSFDLILDIKNLQNWPKYLEKESYSLFQPWHNYGVSYLRITPKYKTNSLAYVPISNGCNNFCTYCVVPFTRGPLICRDHEEILREVKRAVSPIRNTISNRAREIWLLGQNVNDYTSPGNSLINFPKLLKMVNDIPGKFVIRFTSPNPKNFSDELIKVMAESEKIAKFLNLPVQSGDNEILKKMNRPYTVEQYKDLVKKIREKIPNINLSTDVIVGFPEETKKQFQNTAKLFKEMKFNIAYIAKYSPRPGTAAFKMKDDVPREEKEKRWKDLNDLILKNKNDVK